MADYHVAFWNLENLFAPEGWPDRPDWLAAAVARDLSGWTEALFETKIGRLAEVIASLNSGRGPDLLGVCEVENAFALETLAAAASARLPGRDYGVVHVDASREKRGIDTAFLYARDAFDPPRPDETFSHWVMRRTGTRDITQATFRTRSGAELIAFSNHWPSRSGGTIESAGFRMTAGETLGYWHGRVLEIKRGETGDYPAVIAMGDFNDDPWDASMTYHARATRERGDLSRATSARFYNLAWSYLRQEVESANGRRRTIDGTLYYGGDGNVFDQILVSRGLLAGDPPLMALAETARIETHPAFVSTRAGEGPIRFGLPRGDAAANVNPAGASDHFPVSVIVREG